MKKIFKLLIFIFAIFIALPAKAVCPVCIVAVGAGVGLSRWLGIDDIISGLWVGGLIISISFWTLDWLRKKNKGFKMDWLVVFILFYIMVILPLYYYGIIGRYVNSFLGIEKLIFGIIAGSAVFLLSVYLHNFLKSKNQGKSYFPYQKVAIPVLLLIITSLIFYLILIWQK